MQNFRSCNLCGESYELGAMRVLDDGLRICPECVAGGAVEGEATDKQVLAEVGRMGQGEVIELLATLREKEAKHGKQSEREASLALMARLSRVRIERQLQA